MDLIGDIAAIRTPVPQPGDVTPEEFYADAREQAEQARKDDATNLQAQCDGLDEDPLLLALGNARARTEAADREIRLLLAYGREFHGNRPYKLDPLAEASGMTPPASAPPTAAVKSKPWPARSTGRRTVTGPGRTETGNDQRPRTRPRRLHLPAPVVRTGHGHRRPRLHRRPLQRELGDVGDVSDSVEAVLRERRGRLRAHPGQLPDRTRSQERGDRLGGVVDDGAPTRRGERASHGGEQPVGGGPRTTAYPVQGERAQLNEFGDVAGVPAPSLGQAGWREAQ